jgi:hypothetical protein
MIILNSAFTVTAVEKDGQVNHSPLTEAARRLTTARHAILFGRGNIVLLLSARFWRGISTLINVLNAADGYATIAFARWEAMCLTYALIVWKPNGNAKSEPNNT